mmetsp:Transcript_1146/g.1466  ORF Transcript_1146/g.1466 Transcript_1146/m.1466 type:complete len:750 (+) Transcript_1146:68-2317(+)
MRRHGNDARSIELPDADLEDGMESDKYSGSPWRILQLARPEWPWLGLGLILLVGSLIPFLILPIMIGLILDALVDENSKNEQIEEINKIIVILIITLIGGALFALARSFVFNTAGERVVARLRIQLFTAIINQEIGLFDRRKTGELLSRLSTDTTSLQDVATSSISMFFRGLIQLVFNATIMFVTSWRLTLVVFGVVPVVIISIALYGRAVRRLATKYSDALGVATDTAQESISNVRTMRVFAGEIVEVIRYSRSIGDPDALGNCCWFPSDSTSTYALGVKKQLLTASFIAFTSTAGLGAFVLVVWYGARLVIQNDLSIGSLVAFMLYTTQIGASIGMLSGLVGSLYVALGASKRTFQLIDRIPLINSSGGLDPDNDDVHLGHHKNNHQSLTNAITPPPSSFRGDIQFENVSFAYPTRPNVNVIENLNLSIPKNATFAIVGSSGAGKSTLLQLIERMYDPCRGRVLLDQCDIKLLDPRYLRRHISIVAQEPVLFGMTIAENIAYGYSANRGDPDMKPSFDQIRAAAVTAFAHDFIDSFPEKYDTIVGERGVRLSGGQKQRIAIARAILVDPQVLLLDEATSALDAESEHLVQQAIDAAMKNRTVLVVAHRLSTVRNAESIVVLANQSVSAIGKHDELMETSTFYKDLVKRQLTPASTSSSTSATVISKPHALNGNNALHPNHYTHDSNKFIEDGFNLGSSIELGTMSHKGPSLDVRSSDDDITGGDGQWAFDALEGNSLTPQSLQVNLV